MYHIPEKKEKTKAKRNMKEIDKRRAIVGTRLTAIRRANKIVVTSVLYRKIKNHVY